MGMGWFTAAGQPPILYPFSSYPLVNVYIAIEAMAIEIVDLPVENGDFPLLW